MSGFSSIDFSFLIAFVLPGFVAVFSLSYISEWVKLMFSSVLSKDASTGGAFLITIASLAAGMIVSASRALILDWIQHRTGVEKQKVSVSSITDPAVLAAFKEAIQNTYRYSQASGNMMISLTMLFVFKFLVARNGVREGLPIFLCTIATIVVLFFSHRSLLRSTYENLAEILCPPKAKGTTA